MNIILREYGRVVWQKKYFFFLVLFALACATTLDLTVPVFYKNIANGLTEPYSEETLEVLLANLTLIALFYVGVWCSWRLLEVGIIPLDGGGVNLLEKRCFEVLQQQKYSFFENNFSGSLIKQAYRFSSSFEILMDWFLFHFFQSILAIIISFVIFSQQQTDFALYFLIWVIAFISWNVGFSIWKLRFDKEVAKWDSKVGGAYSDAISNIFVVKSFALEAAEQSNVDHASNLVYKKKKVAWILMFVSFAIQGLMTFSIELVLIYSMIAKWKTGQFQVGEFVLFQSILLMLIQRLWEFGRNLRNFSTAVANASEMGEIFRQNDIEKDHEKSKPLTIKNGDIFFDKVSFNYSSAKQHSVGLFQNFSLKIKAREKIALVGSTGSGKTSLTKLLLRYFEPQNGALYFDGMDAKDFTLKSLRSQISLVPQQPELFHRSIRENMTLGKEISNVELIELAKKSRCLDFIENLPEKFETPVGERGVKLSGGEKQRITIARAFLEEAPILVLDEATSALDSLTEKQIQVAIFELIKDKTAIVIAHRLSTILRMDRILVLDAGRIIEEGTHNALLEKRGKYYAMWEQQSGNFLDLA